MMLCDVKVQKASRSCFLQPLCSCASDLNNSRSSFEDGLRGLEGRKHLSEALRFRTAFEDAVRGLDFYSFEPHLTLTIRFSLSHKNAPQVTH